MLLLATLSDEFLNVDSSSYEMAYDAALIDDELMEISTPLTVLMLYKYNPL